MSNEQRIIHELVARFADCKRIREESKQREHEQIREFKEMTGLSSSLSQAR